MEPDVYVIMAAPSSNGRFGGKVSEILIGDGVLRFSSSGVDNTNLALDADSRLERVVRWDLRWNGTATPPASITAKIAEMSSARPPTGVSTGSFEHNPNFFSSLLASLARDASKELKKFGLCSNEPVLTPVGGRAEDISAILAVIDAGGVAVPFHRKSHRDTRSNLESASSARFALSTPDHEKRGTPLPIRISKTLPPKRPFWRQGF